MNTSKTFRLSKTLYCKGKNCAKALWLHIHNPDVATPIDSYKRRLFDHGHNVGKRATQSYPDGILIDIPRENGEEALKKTNEILSTNPIAIFEGAFIYENVLVRVDILENNYDGTWNLIEVKSSSHVKPNAHFDDVAIQKWVLTGSGINIRDSFVMLPTRGFSPKGILDTSGKFVKFKIDEEIKKNTEVIAKNILNMQNHLNSNEPNIQTGEHCKSPYVCEFKTHCKRQARIKK